MVRSSKRGNRFSANNCLRLATAMVLTWTTAGYPVFAQTPPPPEPSPAQIPPPLGSPPAQPAAPPAADVQGYSMTDLQYLLGPIALFPDPLLALVFPASNFPDQLMEAKNWIANNPQAIANNDFSAVDSMPWDPTVQALARFPDVIEMLTAHPDWTESIAWAFSAQHEDVAAAIQLLRAQAERVGNLKSTPQQVVTTREDNGARVIYIAPANPERIYVPVYDPGVVFDSAMAGALFFTTAVIVGSTWNNRWGWNNRSWNQVWIQPPRGWRPIPPGRPGGRPIWRPDDRPNWRPDRPNNRPDRPNFRPDRPGSRPDGGGGGGGVRPDRPDRPNVRPDRPGGRPDMPSARPDRPNVRPDRPGAGRPDRPNVRPDRPGAGRPDRPNVRPDRPGAGRPNVRPETRPSRPGAGQNRPQRPDVSNRPNIQRPQQRPQARPQQRPQARPQQRPQARPQQRPQARPQQPQARPQARPSRPQGGGQRQRPNRS